MSEFHARAVTDALNRMFQSDWFSISTVNECMRVMRSAKTEDYDALRLYHCKNFSDMSHETKQWVFRVTLENVSNVDAFPEIQLVNRSEQLRQVLTVAAPSEPKPRPKPRLPWFR